MLSGMQLNLDHKFIDSIICNSNHYFSIYLFSEKSCYILIVAL